MDRTKLLAQYLVYRYEKVTKSSFNSDELKLQKLMYFLQKYSLAIQNKPLFEEYFQGWKHGPVLVSLRHFFDEFLIDKKYFKKLKEIEKFLIELVIQEYGQYDTWKLRDLSHNEISWIKSRQGLKKDQAGTNKLKLEDIKADAKNMVLYKIDKLDDFKEDSLTVKEEEKIKELLKEPFYNFDDLVNEMELKNGI